MDKLKILKAGVGLVVSTGVGAIVGNAVKATTPSDIKKISKISVGIGSLVLTALLGDMAAKYAESEIDSVIEAVTGLNKEKDEEIGETEGEA